MERPEYMRMPIKIIPQEIIDKYNLNDIVNLKWVYIKVPNSMYGIPIADKFEIDLLEMLMGKKRDEIPSNSVQIQKAKQKHTPQQRAMAANANYVSDNDYDALSDLDANHISESDDEEDDIADTTIHYRARRSKRIIQLL